MGNRIKALNGFTLIETIITIIMLIVLTGGIVYVFRAGLLGWSSQEKRTGIDINLDRGIEEIVRDLREAKEAQSASGSHEIRFTPDQSTYYIYYFYNANDSYPPAFNQDTYELKKTTLSGGINGTFTYGSGQVIVTDVIKPSTSTLSLSSNLITIDLSITRADETIRSRTQVKPRNL